MRGLPPGHVALPTQGLAWMPAAHGTRMHTWKGTEACVVSAAPCRVQPVPQGTYNPLWHLVHQMWATLRLAASGKVGGGGDGGAVARPGGNACRPPRQARHA